MKHQRKTFVIGVTPGGHEQDKLTADPKIHITWYTHLQIIDW